MTIPGGNLPYRTPIEEIVRRLADVERGLRTVPNPASANQVPAWQTPAYNSTDWSDYTATPNWLPLRYALLPSGYVDLSGICIASSSASSATVMFLPPGFRPSGKRRFSATGNNGSGSMHTDVDVWPDGSVVTSTIGTSWLAMACWFYADGD